MIFYLCKCSFKKYLINKKRGNKIFLVEPDPDLILDLDPNLDPTPDPLIRGTDPRIRIRILTKMSRITYSTDQN